MIKFKIFRPFQSPLVKNQLDFFFGIRNSDAQIELGNESLLMIYFEASKMKLVLESLLRSCRNDGLFMVALLCDQRNVSGLGIFDKDLDKTVCDKKIWVLRALASF